MLARRLALSARSSTLASLRYVPRNHWRPVPSTSRAFSMSPLETLSTTFLELGATVSTLPLPGWIGPYSATIIFITMCLRFGITLPISIWSRNRIARLRDIVQPELKHLEKEYALGFKEEVAKKRLPAEKVKVEFEKFKEETGPLLVKKRTELLKLHRCHPIPTFALPLVHVPFFVLYSFTLQQAATTLGTPLFNETFFSDGSLAQSDPTGFFPIAVGLTSLAGLEISRYFTSDKKKARWEQLLEQGLRGLSVLVIAIATQAPGAVTLYWLSSTSWTFVQNVVLGYTDRQRRDLVARQAQRAGLITPRFVPRHEQKMGGTTAHLVLVLLGVRVEKRLADTAEFQS
ncbi:hypothetical protein BOTBODRAFT_189028 [Botryobasidium botryosum FD-172 SS1]|uniref:Uncharacterized protein n=1 Tax=Botryobasidium botryosum (strain FD-172 SS1) TaxID=930990 RepID=A0A067MMG5_BOTB1|nr:hypothetical protein BOTBODRAFT_189028 [Botryobasidium botryosum FD-172 SS1]